MNWHDLARTQGGVISRAQLFSCQLTKRQLDRLIVRELAIIHPGIYLHRSTALGTSQRRWCAVLASGGVLSQRSAASLWRIECPDSDSVTVTVSDRCYRHPAPGVRVWRVPLERWEQVRVAGLPVTDRRRTIVDLLRTEQPGVALTVLDRCIQQQWISSQDVELAIARNLGRQGNTQLRRLLNKIEPGAHAESERMLHQLLRQAGITGWMPQLRVTLPKRSAYVDVGFPDLQVAIEVDGRRYHDASSQRFEDDRIRQNALVAAGWVVLRFTWRRMIHDPAGVIAEIRSSVQV